MGSFEPPESQFCSFQPLEFEFYYVLKQCENEPPNFYDANFEPMLIHF